jgi:hypothetical protein
MTTPPPYDFGPAGQQPDVPDPDLTQPVNFPPMTQPVAAQPWVAPPPSPWRDAGWEGPPEEPGRGNFATVLIALAVGSLVAVAIGAYGGLHNPTGEALNLAGFSSGLHAKVWLGSLAFVLAIVQVLSALAMYGRLPGVAGGGKVTGIVHKWSGRLAVVVTLPVAAHCLYALGFQGFNTRVLAHSLLGCFFYGIFVCKMLVLSRDRRPGWAVPVAGGILFTGLTGLWLTSSLWFFSETGVQF